VNTLKIKFFRDEADTYLTAVVDARVIHSENTLEVAFNGSSRAYPLNNIEYYSVED